MLHPQRQRSGVHVPQVQGRLERVGVKTLYIEPGSPWERLSPLSRKRQRLGEEGVEMCHHLSHTGNQSDVFRLAA